MKINVKKFEELTTHELYELLRLRAEVFVVEQECVYQDLDNVDLKSIHVWVEDKGEVVSYLRVIDKGDRLDEVSIGRVISLKRRKGYGTIAMKEGIRVAKEYFNAKKIKIGAQKYAIPFYENVGFKVISGDYLEDGIPHVYMEYSEKGQ